MSDETRSPSFSTPQTSVHTCARPGCKAFGMFGYDGGRGITEWWCWEDVPRDEHGERKMSY